MTLKQRFEEFLTILTPEPKPVGTKYCIAALIYQTFSTVIILIGLVLTHILSMNAKFSLMLKILELNIFLSILVLISWFLLERGIRKLWNRFVPYMTMLINHILTLYFLSVCLPGNILNNFRNALIFSFTYLILNVFYQMWVIEYFRGASEHKRLNWMYLPFGVLTFGISFMFIIVQLFSLSINFLYLGGIGFATAMYQLALFSYVHVIRGENKNQGGQNFIKSKRYDKSFTKLLSQKRKGD